MTWFGLLGSLLLRFSVWGEEKRKEKKRKESERTSESPCDKRMFVSRLVYFVCLLEAVLWVQPNFALNNQRDMTILLQTQTHHLNELVQNVVCAARTQVLFR